MSDKSNFQRMFADWKNPWNYARIGGAITFVVVGLFAGHASFCGPAKIKYNPSVNPEGVDPIRKAPAYFDKDGKPLPRRKGWTPQ